jgi:hypothetical protein
MTQQRNEGVRLHLREMAKQPGGFATGEITGFDPKAVQLAAWQMAKIGSLHKVKTGHRTVRFFDTAQKAADYEAAHRARHGVTVVTGAILDPRQVQGPAIVPDGVKVTRQPTPRGRFDPDPAAIKPGAFIISEKDMPAGRWSEYVTKEN